MYDPPYPANSKILNSAFLELNCSEHQQRLMDKQCKRQLMVMQPHK